MSRAKATTYLLPYVGLALLVLALMELLSLQNELFRMLFYWTYIVCIPGIVLFALSLVPVKSSSWRMFFMPAALLCFMMPFICWHERTLVEGYHVYFCCHAALVALYWLLFTVISVLRELYPSAHFFLKWVRQFVLYAMLVPSCALISANFGTVVNERGFDIFKGGLWISWCRYNMSMAPLRYIAVIALLMMGCIVMSINRTEDKTSEIEDGD